MDAYILDKNFQEIAMFDAFKSFVWTERYASTGEAVLTIDDSFAVRSVVKEGNFLATNESQEVTEIQSREIKDGVVQATGASLVDIFRNRFVKRSWDNQYGAVPFLGSPTDVPNELVSNFVVPGSGGIMESGDVLGVTDGAKELIPNLSVLPPDIQVPSMYPTTVAFSISNGDLYSAVKSICDQFELGFKVYLKNVTPDSYQLVFQVYAGKDRTSLQLLNPVVRFQSALDSLTGVNELRSIKEYKNVAWAFATNIVSVYELVGSAERDGGFDKTGFDRKTLFVPVDDIQSGDVDLTTAPGRTAFQALLDQRAADALANNNYVRMVNGEIVPQNSFVYGIDYDLGDIIELQASSGDASIARITEYIRTQDTNGFSAYPTLSVIS